jgi:hypothetical protein
VTLGRQDCRLLGIATKEKKTTAAATAAIV